MRINDLSILVYTQAPDELLKCFGRLNLIASQLTDVRQIVIVYNSATPVPKQLQNYTQAGRISILETKERLSQGASLNKSLAHLWNKYVLMLEPSCSCFMSIIQEIAELSLPPLNPLLLNIPLKHSNKPFYEKFQQRQQWRSYNIKSLSFLPWGVCMLERDFLSNLGGFNEELSYHDMMLDLSMRSHNQQGILLELNVVPHLCGHIPLSSIVEQITLTKKYFNSSQGFFQWFWTFAQKTSFGLYKKSQPSSKEHTFEKSHSDSVQIH